MPQNKHFNKLDKNILYFELGLGQTLLVENIARFS